MKTLALTLSLLLLFSGSAFAKGGSGGQLPSAPASSLDQPAVTGQPSTPAPAPFEPALSPSGTSAPPAAEKKEAVKAPVKKEEPKTPSAPAELKGKKHCGELEKLEDRIKCRLNVNEEVLKEELKTTYFPEGCRRGSSEWQNACKSRYKEIGPCWYLEKTEGDKYPSKKIYSCLKQKLKLADELKSASSYCKDKDEKCQEEYKKSIYNLIIARFYDAEQRAEDFLTQGRLSKEDTEAFIIFISQKKLAFYDATTKAQRVQLIQDVASEWQKLLKKVK